MCSCQQTLKPIKVTVTEFRSILNTETGDTLVFSLELGNKMRKDLVWTRVWAWYGSFFGRIDTCRYDVKFTQQHYPCPLSALIWISEFHIEQHWSASALLGAPLHGLCNVHSQSWDILNTTTTLLNNFMVHFSWF